MLTNRRSDAISIQIIMDSNIFARCWREMARIDVSLTQSQKLFTFRYFPHTQFFGLLWQAYCLISTLLFVSVSPSHTFTLSVTVLERGM